MRREKLFRLRQLSWIGTLSLSSTRFMFLLFFFSTNSHWITSTLFCVAAFRRKTRINWWVISFAFNVTVLLLLLLIQEWKSLSMAHQLSKHFVNKTLNYINSQWGLELRAIAQYENCFKFSIHRCWRTKYIPGRPSLRMTSFIALRFFPLCKEKYREEK